MCNNAPHSIFQLFSRENERFGGECLLSKQEKLRQLTHCVDGWTDCSIKLFARHKPASGYSYVIHVMKVTAI